MVQTQFFQQLHQPVVEVVEVIQVMMVELVVAAVDLDQIPLEVVQLRELEIHHPLVPLKVMSEVHQHLAQVNKQAVVVQQQLVIVVHLVLEDMVAQVLQQQLLPHQEVQQLISLVVAEAVVELQVDLVDLVVVEQVHLVMRQEELEQQTLVAEVVEMVQLMVWVALVDLV